MVEPTRRTQEERSAGTRTRLLDATVACLLDLGYHGTTTSAVQARAGVSRGALMHHYSSKADLLVAAAGHLARQRGANLAEQAARLADDDDRISQAIDLLWDTFTGPLFTANLELWAAARTDAELRTALAESERGLRSDLQTVLAELFGARLSAEPAFSEAVELTLQFMRGAALTSILRANRAKQALVIEEWKTVFAAFIQSRAATSM